MGNSSDLAHISKNSSRVSIGLPVFNGEIFLEESLKSICEQTYSNFELIISDNASTDRTEEICRAYAAKDRRIRYIRNEENLGAAENYNQCFSLAKGDYFKWAAHDDICAPEYLAQCVDVLDRCPAVVLCYPKTVLIDAQGEKIEVYEDRLDLRAQHPFERYRQFHGLYRFNRMCNPVFGLMRSSALAKTPLIKKYVASDMVLLAELALLGEFCEVPRPLFFRREHAKRSVQANPDAKERTRWFDSSSKGNIYLPTWRWLGEYLAAIKRVRMGPQEKILCYAQMGTWALRWKRSVLIDEFLQATKQHLRPNPGRQSRTKVAL